MDGYLSPVAKLRKTVVSISSNVSCSAFGAREIKEIHLQFIIGK